jgi:mono/diheme cytochrome c family protein
MTKSRSLLAAVSIALAALTAACGGGSSKPAPATPAADPVPMSEPTAAPAEPAAPAELAAPAKPAEPPAPDPAKIKADLLAAETAAFEKAKPVFDTHCARCHAKGGKLATRKKLEHFDMTTYPFGGEHAGEISKEIREVLGFGGHKVTMPFDKKGAVKGDELALIMAWADAFDASHKGGAHEGHGGGGHKH